MELEPLGQLAKCRLRGSAARVRDEPDDVWLPGEAAVGLELVDRRDLAAGGADGPLEVGGFRVQDPVQIAAECPRDLSRLDLEERAASPDPAEEQADRVALLPGDDAPAAPNPTRGRQPIARR